MINGFKILEDLGPSGKRHYLLAECKVCFNSFKIEKQSLKRPNRISCSRSCTNQYWLDSLQEYQGFKILKVNDLVKNKRSVTVECKLCKNPFESTLQSLIRTNDCGCSVFTINVNKRLVRIRNNMIQRCHNKKSTNFIRYGARGISVCDEWLEPSAKFFEWALNNGYQDYLSLDRIDNDGNYEPQNCRWATRKEQMANTRKSKRIISCI